MGSPLLDIMVTVPQEFIHKYDLKENEIRVISNEQLNFYNDIINDIIQNYKSDIQYIAGGSAQNSIRVAQWIIESQNACVFVGSIGKDYFGKTLFQKALEDGIVGQYQLVPEMPTGTCLALVSGKGKRTLIACPAAAELLKIGFLEEKEIFIWLQKAKFFYLTAYSLQATYECSMYVAKYAVNHNRRFMFHLSAPYIFERYIHEMNTILPYVDVLIGSKEEALAFAASQNFGTTDLQVIASKTCAIPILNQTLSRIVIFTQGVEPVVVARDKGTNVRKYKTIPVPKASIKDFNGAGDAFAGGFIAQLAKGSSIEICVQCGLWAASEVIQLEGCQFPKSKYFKPFLLNAVRE